MDNKFKDLDDTFNVETEVVEDDQVKIKKTSLSKESTATNDVRKDYEYTRGNLYSIIEKGQEALDNALELAVEGGQPRAYEVVGQLIKNVSDATDKLLDLQKKLKGIEDTSITKSQTNVTNNALFVGSTADLSKFLKSTRNSLSE
jgi:methylmalonyl-CoA mutase N-terminal domain/subunit